MQRKINNGVTQGTEQCWKFLLFVNSSQSKHCSIASTPSGVQRSGDAWGNCLIVFPPIKFYY